MKRKKKLTLEEKEAFKEVNESGVLLIKNVRKYLNLNISKARKNEEFVFCYDINDSSRIFFEFEKLFISVSAWPNFFKGHKIEIYIKNNDLEYYGLSHKTNLVIIKVLEKILMKKMINSENFQDSKYLETIETIKGLLDCKDWTETDTIDN